MAITLTAIERRYIDAISNPAIHSSELMRAHLGITSVDAGAMVDALRIKLGCGPTETVRAAARRLGLGG